MNKFNFEASTPQRKPKKPTITNKHILDTRSNNPKRTKRKKEVIEEAKHAVIQEQAVEENSLTTTISENYEGKVGGIIAYIDSLPKHLQVIIRTNKVKTTLARQGYTMYVLEGGATLKITETKLGNKHKLFVEVKQGKKRLMSKHI
jgi:accessory colonization factor AcfC